MNIGGFCSGLSTLRALARGFGVPLWSMGFGGLHPDSPGSLGQSRRLDVSLGTSEFLQFYGTMRMMRPVRDLFEDSQRIRANAEMRSFA